LFERGTKLTNEDVKSICQLVVQECAGEDPETFFDRQVQSSNRKDMEPLEPLVRSFQYEII
jgi:hypothetical protein